MSALGPLRPELCGVGSRGRRPFATKGRTEPPRGARACACAGLASRSANRSTYYVTKITVRKLAALTHAHPAPNRCIWIFGAYNRGCVNKAALARMLGALGRVGEPSLSTNLVHPPPAPGFKSAARGRVGGGAGVRVCGTAPSVGVEQRRARLGRKVASSRGTRASFFHVAPLPAGRGSKRVMGRSCSGGAADPGIENEARTGL